MAIDNEPPLERPVSEDDLPEIMKGRLGAPVEGLLLEPYPLLPFGLMEVTPGHCVALASAEFLVYPPIEWGKAARIGLHCAASTAAASGLPLKAASISLSIPANTPENDVESFWKRINREAEKLEIAVVSTTSCIGRCAQLPLIGSCSILAAGLTQDILSAAGANDGDAVLMTKYAGFEAVALLSRALSHEVEEVFGEGFTEDAATLYKQLSCIREVNAIRLSGGNNLLTSLHHAGRKGILDGLQTIARSSDLGIDIDRANLPLTDEADAFLTHFDLDPLQSGGQGTLLMTCAPYRESEVLAIFRSEEIPCCRIGMVSGRHKGVRVFSSGVEESPEALVPRRTLQQILNRILTERVAADGSIATALTA